MSRSKNLRKAGRHDEATLLVEAAMQALPDSVALINEYGQIAFEQKRLETARRRFEDAHRLAPRDRYATNNLGKVSLRLQDYAGARRWYGATLELNSSDLFALTGMGQASSRSGKFDEAKEWFARALEQRPNDRVVLNEQRLLTGARKRSSALRKAFRLRRKRRFDDAVQAVYAVLGDAARDPMLLHELGEIALARRDPSEAEKWFNRALQFNPDFSPSAQGLERAAVERKVQPMVAASKSLRKEGKPLAAAEYLDAALTEFPNHPSLSNELGQAFSEGGDREGAGRQFRATLATSPRDVVAMVNLGRLAREEGDTATARRWFRSALEQDPENAYALNLMGDLNRLGGNESRAERWYKKTLASRPADPYAMTGLGLLAVKGGRFNRAREWFEQVLALRPGDPVAVNGLQGIEQLEAALPVVAQARTLRKRKEYGKAEKLLLNSLSRYNNNPSLLIELGFVAHCENRYDEARTLFEMAQRKEPRNVVVLIMLGVLELKRSNLGRKDFERAERLLNRARRLKPNDTNVLNNLGWLEIKRGNLERADEMFIEVLSLDCDSPRAIEGRGEVAMRRGDYEEAQQWWEKAWWDLDRENPYILNNLAKLSMAQGDLAAARSLLEDALALAPADVHVLTSLGYLGMLEGRHGEAQRCLDRVYALNPDDDRILNLKGKFAQKKGNLKEAAYWFSETLSRYPDNVYALNGLGWTAYEARQYPAAQMWFEQALEADPGNAHALTGLGITKARRGEYDEAEECYLTTLQKSFHPPALWHWFRVTTILGNAQKLSWFLQAALETGRAEKWVSRELAGWERRVGRLMAITRQGEDPWPYVESVSRELPHMYHANESAFSL